MKNKNILLSDLLFQREVELIIENLGEVDLNQAKEKGKQKLKQASDTTKKVAIKLKQSTKKAIEVGKQKAQDIQDSPQFQKVKGEIEKEIKDPKRSKAAVKGLVNLLMKASAVFNSTMKSEKKRKVLKTLFASNLALIGGAAGVAWDLIRKAVENATTIHYDGVFGIGGFDKAGTQLGDPFILDFLGDALPYMIALRVILALYDIRGTIKTAASIGKGVRDFARDARDIVRGKDTTNETLSEDMGPDLEDIAMKAIDIAI